MSQALQVGDLACVVRACCPEKFGETGGTVATVAWIAHARTHCRFCGTRFSCVHAASSHERAGAPVAWLKRIDPQPDSSGTTRPEELVEQA